MTTQDRNDLKLKLKEAIEQSPNRAIIKRASLFGSYAYGTPTEESDVDLLVEFEPNARVGFFKLSEFKFSIQDRIGKKVDVLTQESISKYFRDEVLSQAQLVYEN